jgi:KaiC/GvpD/RAD55 family RecA-like ATPase
MSHVNELRQELDTYIDKAFGEYVPPSPYVTPFGVRHFDALMGGGFLSSAPICLTSTPETGKSTVSLQFGAQFLKVYEDSIVLYINIEEPSSNKKGKYDNGTDSDIYTDRMEERLKTFGIDMSRFIYKPVEFNIPQVFELIRNVCDIKKKLEEKYKTEYRLLVIWDSIAATPSSKEQTASDPNEIIG